MKLKSLLTFADNSVQSKAAIAGLGGAARNIDLWTGSASAAAFSSSGTRACWYRWKGGHGQKINTIQLEVVATSSDTLSLAIGRQASEGAVNAALPIIASSGSISSPSVGVATVSLDSAQTLDLRTDWIGGSQNGIATTIRSATTHSSATNNLPHGYGDFMIQFGVHPLATGGTGPDGSATTGARIPNHVLLGKFV